MKNTQIEKDDTKLQLQEKSQDLNNNVYLQNCHKSTLRKIIVGKCTNFCTTKSINGMLKKNGWSIVLYKRDRLKHDTPRRD